MRVADAAIPDVKVISVDRHDDDRGFFSEAYNRRDFFAAGVTAEFVQDNQSKSIRRGTVRGLHYQVPPRAQSKLIRVTHGAIYDVAVDLRRGSATFGRHVAHVISAADRCQMYVPVGFAHGFATMEPDTEVLYKVTDYYAPNHEAGVRWDDPALEIDWPVRMEEALLSERDRKWPSLAELENSLPF